MARNIGIVIYVILQFIAFFFVLICAVISIFVYGAAFVLGFLMLCFHLLLRWVFLGLNVAGVVTLFIIWASMVATYYRDDGDGCEATSRLYNYAAGFILFLVAWCLDIINIGLLLLPFADTLSLGSAKKEPSTRPEEEEVK